MKHAASFFPGLCCFIISISCTAASCTAGEYPVEQWKAWPRPTADCYPREHWAAYATPEEAGWSSEKLDEARAYFDQIDSSAVMVVYDGAVLAQWGDVGRRFMCHSVRKSLLSALYGVHVNRDTIDLDRTLTELKLDDEPPLSKTEKQARVIDLLTSRSGVYHTAAYETAKMKDQRPKRDSRRPGELFWYNNWDFNALCTIFEQQTRTRVFEEFQKQFATPLGMEDFRLQDTYYHLEPHHSIHPAYPFRMSARDLARFGLLFLRDGKWHDRRILSSDWVARSTASSFRESDTTSNPNYAYGYLWWRVVDGPFEDLGMYSARGYGGHAIDIVPAANLVLVHRVNTYWDLTPQLTNGRNRVETTDRFELLDRILRARVGPPKSNPKLRCVKTACKRADTVRLDPAILDRYARSYDFETFQLKIQRAGDRLLIGGPGMGDFTLVPFSETKFVIEDIESPVTFDLDESGNPRQLTIGAAPGKVHQGRPVCR